eukprot:TRINITY_DN4116_c0_g1_i1.p1 TRINITY_DN4116_c0_g1~~TRINITY_DN4116_c0_g1_i1.p1  ORF type:complete len:120 (-),score=13.54 TRINITY_DN4116_c0_g1_i1:24-383(-)
MIFMSLSEDQNLLALGLELPEVRSRPPPSDGEILTVNDGAKFTVANENDEGYRTPTSKEHMIPATRFCPPAPKKVRRVALRKRKLSKLQFFEVSHDELELIFQRDPLISDTKKCRFEKE